MPQASGRSACLILAADAPEPDRPPPSSVRTTATPTTSFSTCCLNMLSHSFRDVARHRRGAHKEAARAIARALTGPRLHSETSVLIRKSCRSPPDPAKSCHEFQGYFKRHRATGRRFQSPAPFVESDKAGSQLASRLLHRLRKIESRCETGWECARMALLASDERPLLYLRKRALLAVGASTSPRQKEGMP